MKKSELRNIIKEIILQEAISIDFAYVLNDLKKYKNGVMNIDDLVDSIAANAEIKGNKQLHNLKEYLIQMDRIIKKANPNELKKIASEILDGDF